VKGQDIVILLKLICLHKQELASSREGDNSPIAQNERYSVRGLAASLGISKSEVAASLNRSLASGLASHDRSFRRIKPNRRDLCDFIIHGLKFVFPATLGAPERGTPTAFSAPMLKGQIVSAGQEVIVWPNAAGKERGVSVTPLFGSIPDAVQNDPALYRYLALIDAIRLGRQREANLASEQLKTGLLQE
jgi:hypothetical protein